MFLNRNQLVGCMFVNAAVKDPSDVAQQKNRLPSYRVIYLRTTYNHVRIIQIDRKVKEIVYCTESYELTIKAWSIAVSREFTVLMPPG